MRPKHVKQALKVAIKAKRPMMLHGSPGTGKSNMVAQVAQELGLNMIDLRLSQLDPVDLRGVPSVSKKSTTAWNTPNFLPSEGNGILFFDEINSAPQATQAAAYQLILDRKLGDYTLPDGWSMIAAGNRAKDRAIVNQMSTALKNRFSHIDVEVNTDDWCEWALTSDIDVAVLSFIRFRPMLLNEFEARNNDKKEQDRINKLRDQNAFATPRTWEYLSDMIKDNEIDKEIEAEVFSGIVGEGPAAEFSGFLRVYRELPDLTEVLLNPTTATVPKEPAAMYAVCTGLASRINADNCERALSYTSRLPTEYQALTVKDALIRFPDIKRVRAYQKWALDNGDMLF